MESVCAVGGTLLYADVDTSTIATEEVPVAGASLLTLIDAIVHGLTPMLLNLVVGVVAGGLVLGVVTLIQTWRGADA